VNRAPCALKGRFLWEEIIMQSIARVWGTATGTALWSSAALASTHDLFGGPYHLNSGTLVCATLEGAENAEYGMNEAQLKSLGCFMTKREIPVSATPDPEIGILERVKVVTPNNVFLVWVRTRDVH
jgi:hypothetical protein